jgi:hypothetical protein
LENVLIPTALLFSLAVICFAAAEVFIWRSVFTRKLFSLSGETEWVSLDKQPFRAWAGLAAHLMGAGMSLFLAWNVWMYGLQ